MSNLEIDYKWALDEAHMMLPGWLAKIDIADYGNAEALCLESPPFTYDVPAAAEAFCHYSVALRLEVWDRLWFVHYQLNEGDRDRLGQTLSGIDFNFSHVRNSNGDHDSFEGAVRRVTTDPVRVAVRRQLWEEWLKAPKSWGVALDEPQEGKGGSDGN